jgi:hypothetical protein
MDGRPATPAMPRASGSASASRRASAGSRPSRASTGRNCAGRTGSDGHSPSQPQPKILSACPSYWRRRPDDTPGPRLIGTGRSSTRPPSTTNGDEPGIKSGYHLVLQQPASGRRRAGALTKFSRRVFMRGAAAASATVQPWLIASNICVGMPAISSQPPLKF